MSFNGRQYVEQQLDPVRLGERVWQVLKKPGRTEQPQTVTKRASL